MDFPADLPKESDDRLAFRKVQKALGLGPYGNYGRTLDEWYRDPRELDGLTDGQMDRVHYWRANALPQDFGPQAGGPQGLRGRPQIWSPLDPLPFDAMEGVTNGALPDPFGAPPRDLPPGGGPPLGMPPPGGPPLPMPPKEMGPLSLPQDYGPVTGPRIRSPNFYAQDPAAGLGTGAWRDRADDAIKNGVAPQQNVDSIWALGGRKPNLTRPDVPPAIVAALQQQVVDPETGNQVSRLDWAKRRMADRADNRLDGAMFAGGGRLPGEMQAGQAARLAENRKKMEASAQAAREKDIARNAPRMAASNDQQRRRTGQALLDRLQSGPEQNYVQRAVAMARAAANQGLPFEAQKKIYDAEIARGAAEEAEKRDAAKRAETEKITDRRIQEGRAFTEKERLGTQEFEGAQRGLDRDNRKAIAKEKNPLDGLSEDKLLRKQYVEAFGALPDNATPEQKAAYQEDMDAWVEKHSTGRGATNKRPAPSGVSLPPGVPYRGGIEGITNPPQPYKPARNADDGYIRSAGNYIGDAAISALESLGRGSMGARSILPKDKLDAAATASALSAMFPWAGIPAALWAYNTPGS